MELHLPMETQLNSAKKEKRRERKEVSWGALFLLHELVWDYPEGAWGPCTSVFPSFSSLESPPEPEPGDDYREPGHLL